jgi:diguanylate cyclase
MLAKARAVRGQGGGDLFSRIGDFLRAQGLGPEPVNYAFAHHLLSRGDDAARQIIDRLDDGFRLSRKEIESLGGNVATGPGLAPGSGAEADGDPAAGGAERSAAERLVAQTRVQVESAAATMRAMHGETRDFGRDLAQSAAAFEVEGVPASPDQMLRLTHTMIARVTVAETRLEQAATETESLRAELAEAQATARRDPLTGLPNRRAFDEAFAARAPRGRCLALCDIDRFKRINDGFGHAVGDRVLSATARILADECEGHLVTRQGGEEFAVLIEGNDLVGAKRLIDRAREAVGERRFRTRDTDASIGRVSFSAGIIEVQPGETGEAALARADALLYQAKAAGRDRVIAG